MIGNFMCNIHNKTDGLIGAAKNSLLEMPCGGSLFVV